MSYVLSTMANAVNYTFYTEGGDLPRVKHKILVQGGATLPSRTRGFGEMSKASDGTPMWTPSGIVTPVTPENLEMLKGHPVFKKHLEAGLVKILEKDLTTNHKEVAKAASDMSADGFAQLTAKTINQRIKASVGHPDGDNRI